MPKSTERKRQYEGQQKPFHKRSRGESPDELDSYEVQGSLIYINIIFIIDFSIIEDNPTSEEESESKKKPIERGKLHFLSKIVLFYVKYI